MLRESVVIDRTQELDGRPIAELVQVASKFESRVYLEHDTKKVNAKSIMGMMSLEAIAGDSLVVMIDGTDEKDAMEEITKFLRGNGSNRFHRKAAMV